MIPLGDRVLIAPAQGEEVAPGAIKIAGSQVLRPDTAVRMRPSEGIVEAIGETTTVPVKQGDRVLFRWWSGVEFSLKGQKFVLTEQKNVLAKVEDGERVDDV